jgi:hypothetical protein
MTLCMTFSHVGNTWKTLTIWFAKVGTKQGFWIISMDNSNLKQWKWMLSHLYFQLISFWDQTTRRGGSQYWIQRIPCLKSWNNVWISMFHNYCYCHCYLYCCASKFNNVHRRRFKGCTPPLVATTIVKWLLPCCRHVIVVLPLCCHCYIIVVLLSLCCYCGAITLLQCCCYCVVIMLLQCCVATMLCCVVIVVATMLPLLPTTCCAIVITIVLCCYHYTIVVAMMLFPLHYSCYHYVVLQPINIINLQTFLLHFYVARCFSYGYICKLLFNPLHLQCYIQNLDVGFCSRVKGPSCRIT